jgi:hypothetical protein
MIMISNDSSEAAKDTLARERSICPLDEPNAFGSLPPKLEGRP